jgi:tetratricopeptide (TPR) repeat protein/O-antigen ligase
VASAGEPRCLSVLGTAGLSAAALRHAAHAGLYLLLLGPAVAGGAHRGWPLVLTQFVAFATVAVWLAAMLRERRLEWRPTALDLPLGLLLALVLLQVALGSGALVRWALAPPGADLLASAELPQVFLWLGTASRAQTWRSFLLFLTYAAVYALVVNLVRERQQLDRLVRTLLLSGGLLGFLALLDYLAGYAWLLVWRETVARGRLAGTFVNPDHFATWLAMLACLGLGYLVGRRRRSRAAPLEFAVLASREGREEFARRYLPFVGVGVVALAVVFTLSRGGLVSLLVALAVVLAFLGRLGFARWGLVVVGLLLVVTLAYGAWIGLGPVLERVQRGVLDYESRASLSLSSLPMLKTFPILGVGLGAYKEIYFRYQPPELGPGVIWFPYAHNDLLQLVIELGLVGGVLVLFAAWRLGRDLLGAHVLGVAACPVGGGKGGLAKRTDTFSLGIALGALGGVAALVVHSAGDFSARIPANGILGAALLGVATVALHTRFGATGPTLLTGVRTFRPPQGRRWWAVGAAAALAVALLVLPPIVRPALVERALEPVLSGSVATTPAALAAIDRAVAYDASSPKALGTRAWYRLVTAERIWNRGVSPTGAALGPAERRREATALLDGALEDLRRALAVTPADPFLHERLGWAYGAASLIAPETGAERHGFAHLQRAVALAPGNAFLRRSLALFAAIRPAPRIDFALAAGREAVARDPGLLPELVERLGTLPLAPFQWLALVPDTAVDRLHLATVLERRALVPAARETYAAALMEAPVAQQPLYRWARARMLLRIGEAAAGAAELEAALRQEPDNRELLLARATALSKLGDPTALDLLQRAVAVDERGRPNGANGEHAFETDSARLRQLVAEQFAGWAPDGAARGGGVVRYRYALAQYLAERKLWPQALREWAVVTERTPDDGAAHFGRGLALEGLGRSDEALDAYRRAVALDGQPRFRERLAQRLWDTDQYFQAINEWRAITAREPRNLPARLALARGLLHVGDRMSALREFKAALDLAPGNAEARAGFTRLGGLAN